MIDEYSQIHNIINLLQKKDIKEIISDYEYSLALAEWNIIPYGRPSTCKPSLLVLVDGTVTLSDLFERALKLLGKCTPVCMQVLIYAQVNEHTWNETWFSYSDQFEKLEEQGLNIKIHFE